MSKLQSIYSKVLIAMLVTLSMALFVGVAGIQPLEARAIEIPISLCMNRSNGELNKPGSMNQCPDGFEIITGISQSYQGVCVVKDPNTAVLRWGLRYPEDELTLDRNGKNCVFSDDETTVAGPFVRFDTIPTYNPPNSNNGNGNNGNGNNGNSNNSNNNNGSGNNGNSGNGNTGWGNGNSNQTQGKCESGFHEVGPLCVPDSPFKNQDALINAPDAPSLVVRIIRILLYFAGIVAVIMAIVGGYQVMTAQGNESQAATGRKTLTNAIIGLVIVILSYIIIQAVINFVTK